MNAAARARSVKRAALALGFDSIGITDLAPTPHGDSLTAWLAADYAGTMRYLHRQAARRREPERILPGATRAVVVTRNYYNAEPPPDTSGGRVAKYARGVDYHASMAEPLAALSEQLVSLGASPEATRWYVDAGPVPERELAQRAGLGWIGKNTMLIDQKRGSYFFLACVLTDLDLAIDPPFTADRCGTCTRCLDACPTAAFPAPRVLDATKCIAYGTIEHRGALPPAVADGIGEWVFGCDICNDVCPWNERFATAVGALSSDATMARLPWNTFDQMSEAEFAQRFGATPLERPGLAGMQRNVAR